MRYGTVVQYFPEKGFGFIRADFGPDIFFHVTALGACQAKPLIAPGQPVKYELMSRSEKTARVQTTRLAVEPSAAADKSRERPQAKMVELIDKIPGAHLEEVAGKQVAVHHPRARQRKPTWRR